MHAKDELMKTWFHRVWTEEDPDAIDEMLAPGVEVTGVGAHAAIGPEGFKDAQTAILGLIGDMTVTSDLIVGDPASDWTAHIFTVRGTCRKSKRPVEFGGMGFVRVDGKMIVEGYNTVDWMSLYQQLDLIDRNTLADGFEGKLPK